MSTALYYLCFPDEAASVAVAVALGLVAMTDEGPRLVRYTHRYALDVIGTVFLPTGETITTEEGFDIPVLAAAPGWHVNLAILDGSEIPAECSPFLVYPNTPARVFCQ